MEQGMVDAAARALLDAAPPGSRVILFGSYAKGTAHAGSDLDFLVIEPKVENRFQEMFRLRKVLNPVFGEIIQPVDLIVTDEAHFSKYKETPDTLAFEAATQGHVYE